MSVQEQPHSIYSLNYSSGSSKSTDIQTISLALPALDGQRFLLAGGIPTNFTTGWLS